MLVDVDTDDFVVAARAATSAASTVRQSRNSARGALSGLPQMAGSDPAGRQWASSYDDAAQQAFRGIDGLVAALEQVSAGLVVTGGNYATADWLSAGNSGVAPGFSTPSMPSAECTAPPPSASGGSRSSPIPGFELVANFIGDLWPDGDTGRLDQAASAWSALADGLEQVAGAKTDRIVDSLSGSVTPEMPAIHRTVNEVASQAGEMAEQARAISQACASFARQIDEVHQQTRRELQSLLLQVELTVAGGLVLTVVTAGLSDVAAAAAATAEVAVTVGRITALIARLARLVVIAADDLVTSTTAFVRAAGLSERLGVRLVRFAGKTVTFGAEGAAVDMIATSIVDPEASLTDAGVQGFVGGAAFGVLGQGARLARAGVGARATAARTISGMSRLDVVIDRSTPGGKLIPHDYRPTGNLSPRDFIARHWNPDSVNWDGSRGSWRYPPHDGFAVVDGVVQARDYVGEVGRVYDRYGVVYGDYLALEGASFPGRGLPPGAGADEYHRYRQLKLFDSESGIPRAGPGSPAFEQPGLEIQVKLGQPIRWMIEHNYLKEILQ